MDPEVDFFVLVEGEETFRGAYKPLYYQQNAHLFEEFAHKIIHVVVEPFYDRSASAWVREFYHRDAIVRGLKNCQDDDIILLSDVDELTSREGLCSIKQHLEEGIYPFVGVTHEYHSNFLNSVPGAPMRCTVGTTYKELTKMSMQGMRSMREIVPSVARGWHFTWQGGLEKCLSKIGSFAHAEMDTPELREEKRRQYETMRLTCSVEAIDETYPQYVQDNINYFEEMGFVLTPETQQLEQAQ